MECTFTCVPSRSLLITICMASFCRNRSTGNHITAKLCFCNHILASIHVSTCTSYLTTHTYKHIYNGHHDVDTRCPWVISWSRYYVHVFVWMVMRPIECLTRKVHLEAILYYAPTNTLGYENIHTIFTIKGMYPTWRYAMWNWFEKQIKK